MSRAWVAAAAALVVGVLDVPGTTAASAATLTVNAGGDLQAALNAAQPGDEVVLQAGARFVGSFQLPVKPLGSVITVRSSAALPLRRLTPGDAALLPTIVSGSVEAAILGINAANWRLDGLRFEANAYGAGNVIELQNASNITLDRLVIVGGAEGQKRGILGNGRQIALTRSYIANIWREGQDSQAFCAWDGAGPYTITDNYLEAASENVMFGGADSSSAGNIPADILVENNYVTKRLDWRGLPRNVKNLFELKSAKRVTVRNNLFERNWTDGQSGTAIVFTTRNQEGRAAWSAVEDVLFEHNTVRDTEGIFNILGYDNEQPSGRTTRVTIRHNLLQGSGTFLLAGGEVGTVTVDHNTVDQGYNFATFYIGSVWVAGASAPRTAAFAIEQLTVTNTLGNHNDYGVFGEDSGIGTVALTRHAKSYTWTNNVLDGEGGWGHTYPVITWQPSTTDYRAQLNADYTLSATSAYRGAGTDGQDLGVQWSGTTSTYVPPPPPPSTPAPAEICGDGIDNDGDGLVDEGCAVAVPVPAPVPAPAGDTAGPGVTLKFLSQNPSFYRFRVDAVDPSGIASIVVWFNGTQVSSATSAPLDVNVSLRKLKPGGYSLLVIATDGAGNTTTLDRTVTK